MVYAIGLPFLNELVALFLVSVGIAYICYRLKLVPIVGFLIAGIIIGPNALALVKDQELVNILAEIGVILLLFSIGIEFSLEKLNRIRKAILIGGGLQVALTTAAVVLILNAWGVTWTIGVYTGFLVALSSTAIVLGLLSERGETDTPAGQLSLAVLIFQDLAIIAMVLMVPILAGQSDSGMDCYYFGEAHCALDPGKSGQHEASGIVFINGSCHLFWHRRPHKYGQYQPGIGSVFGRPGGK